MDKNYLETARPVQCFLIAKRREILERERG